MAKLYNFTVNTEFPAIAKTGSYSENISQGSTTTAAHNSSTVTKTIDVASGDIVCAVIEVGGVKYPTSHYIREIGAGGSGIYEEIFVSKSTPTQVEIVMGIWNQTGSSYSHGAWSANVYVNTFNVP